MGQKCFLVISEDAERFGSLRERLANSSLQGSLRLELTPNVATAGLRMSEQDVDVILLDSRVLPHPDAVSVVVKAFAPVPIVSWSDEQGTGCLSELADHGVAASLDDSMTSADLILQTLAIISHHAKTTELVRQQQKEAAVTLEAIADGVVCTDARGEITLLNSAARRLLHCGLDIVVGRQIADLMSLRDADSLEPIVHPVHKVIATMQSTRIAPGTVLIRHNKSEIRIEDCSSPILDDGGTLKGVVMVFHDTTEAYEMQAQVDHLAWHDFLTGLPNRFAIEKHLDQTLAHAGTHHQCVPVIYLDLDKFKLVNDTLGHNAGDKLLVSVGERLRACFRLIDLVGRQGGDEFIVVMAPGSSVDDAVSAAARITEALTRPHQVNGNEVRVGCSVGIAMYPEHGRTVEALIHNADAALQSVKTNGRNSSRVFTQDLHAETLERQLMEDRLRIALLNGTFSLFYQPKIHLPSGSVCGCEALLRWEEPDWGWIPATKFIPCAEASGLIYLLGRWVFDEAIRQAQVWAEEGFNFGAIAINVSAEELRHPEFVEYIRGRLEVSSIDPALLQVELTESVLMHDIAQANRCLKQLKDMGLSLAIDDFGTGYSSLSYLADFPIDVLKIDRSFIHGINRAGTRQQALLNAILSLAKTLSLVVVAEGIETAEEEHFLLQTGCEVGQGYYYSMPLDATTFRQFVGSNTSRS